MARTTLAALIGDLRGMTDAGTADWTQGTAVFWDDDQIQLALDRHRVDIYREQLVAIPDFDGSALISYKTYRSRWGSMESTDGGSAVFLVEDSVGNNQGTADWSADYRRGVVTFGASQGGTIYYLTGRTFDMAAAAADVWRMKAGNAAKQYAFSTDGHNLQRNQILDHCMKMASFYDGRSRPEIVQVNRSDLT